MTIAATPPARREPRRATRLLHLAMLILCVAVAAYAAVRLAADPSLPRVVLWFLAAAVIHDGVLLPLYSGADRVLLSIAPRAPVAVVNHVRVPALASGLTLLLFLPGILRSGEAHFVATGLDQGPYLGRWLLLTAAFFGTSALLYTVRLFVALATGRPAGR